jgi:hypothetical protein
MRNNKCIVYFVIHSRIRIWEMLNNYILNLTVENNICLGWSIFTLSILEEPI